MARKTLEIVAKVIDAATDKLKKIGDSLGGVGKKSKETSSDITKLNRALFATTAFVALFQRGLTNFTSSIGEAASLDRLTNQFERLFGDKSKFFNQLDKATNTYIDRFEAMRSAVSLKSLGIIKDEGKIVNVLAMAGTAAKLAGTETSEGLKEIIEFLKDGSISHAEWLNIIARTNPHLQAELSLLHKAGGALGQVISTQEKQAIVMRLLNAATRNHLHDNKDLLDSYKEFIGQIQLLKTAFFTLVGTALAPYIKKFTEAITKTTEFIETHKEVGGTFFRLVKAVTFAVGSMGTLLAVLGTAKLVSAALGATIIGPMGLLVALGLLTAAFYNVDESAEKSANSQGAFAKLLDKYKTKTLSFSDILSTLADTISDKLADSILDVVEALERMWNWFKKIFISIEKFGESFNLFSKIKTSLGMPLMTTPSGIGLEKTIATKEAEKSILSKPIKTDAIIPLDSIPDDESTRINRLNDTMSKLDEFKAHKMAESIKLAKSKESEGGETITKREYFNIMKEALDSSDNLSYIAGNIKDKNQTPGDRRGL